MNRAQPRAGVVISTRSNARLARAAVESVLAGGTRPDELILVDQSPELDPLVAELGASDGVTVLHSTTIGLSAGQNAAIRSSSSDALFFTDDDVEVAPDWLARMLEALAAAGPRAAVTGRVLPLTAGPRNLALATSEEHVVHRAPGLRDVLSGNSMGVYRSAFEECGLFDERLGPGARFPSAGDNDLGYRLLRAGYEIHYVPTAVVYHHPRPSDRAVGRSMVDMGIGQGAFLMKHALAGDPLMRRRLLGTPAWWIARMLRRRPSDRSRKGHGDIRYLAAFVRGAIGFLLEERRT